jgi:hypothetical protein
MNDPGKPSLNRWHSFHGLSHLYKDQEWYPKPKKEKILLLLFFGSHTHYFIHTFISSVYFSIYTTLSDSNVLYFIILLWHFGAVLYLYIIIYIYLLFNIGIACVVRILSQCTAQLKQNRRPTIWQDDDLFSFF